jgi:sulfatase maturation enzyme AslB (radical SAM superfamily)
MTNDFCRFLSNGFSLLHQQSRIYVKPCCWFDTPIPFNGSDTLKHLHSVTEWHKDCGVCKNQELSGLQSFRQTSFDIVPDTVPPGAIVALDINLDIECNAACIMCTPEYSTLWGKELKKFNISHLPTKSISIEKILKLLGTLDLSQVKRVKFFGGEPLFNDVHIEILKRFPTPSNIDVWYTSNASIYPKQQVLDIWAKFKVVFFEASVDGIGAQFDYIRWPLKWDRVEQNLLRLKEQAPLNVLFRINHTANPLNVLYYGSLLEWIDKNFSTNKVNDPTEINVHPCWGDWDLSKTPTALREKVYQLYPDSAVSNLLKNTEIDPNTSTMSKFVKQWDLRRKNSWRTAFPELIEYLKLDQ